MSWQSYAQRLWGEDWIAPMSEVLDINRRTIERWNAGQGAPATGIQAELSRLSMRSYSRALGDVLRRMANGESVDDIRRDYREHMAATTVIQSELGKYNAIAILASRHELESEDEDETL